jgi:hypothetical protein
MTRRTYPRLLLNLAAATLLVGTVAGQAQADTVWRFPPKGGAPYAVPHEHNDRVALGQKKAKPKAVHARTAKRIYAAGSKPAIR